MKRTPSHAAQATFNLMLMLEGLIIHPRFAYRAFARVAQRIAKPIAKKLGANHLVVATVYRRDMMMPAEHHLPVILATNPQFNQPIMLVMETIAVTASSGGPELTLIDVGANVGETIAIVEQGMPGRCSYLCIEPDPELSTLCRLNHSNNRRVQVEQAFIGEDEGASVWLEDDGRSNPSTKVLSDVTGDKGNAAGRLKRLDTVALPFAELHGGISLIKVDTEGYDFSVLRSGPELLARYNPAIYLEWFPDLLRGLHEQVWEGFDYLAARGYHYLVFFTNRGDFYCSAFRPDRIFFQSLAGITGSNKPIPYFDVFLSTSESLWSGLIERSVPCRSHQEKDHVEP